jgi:hypothetical protein
MPNAKPAGKSSKTKTIIDVAHPNDSAPSPNSKSVIIPNRPILKDPMVVNRAKNEDSEPKGPPPVKDKPADPPAETPKLEPKPEPEPETEPEPKPADKPEPDKTETADTVPEQDSEEKPKADQELQAQAAEQARHDSAVGKLVESKQYYLPINTVEKRRSRRFVALGIILSLLLVVAWADIALDAGLIQLNGVKPLTHFFSN